MAATHGTNAIFKVTSGSLRDISNYLETADFQRAIETAETSGLGDTAKEFVLGLSEGKISGNGQYDATFDGYLAVIEAARVAVAFEFNPSGTATGAIKYSGSVLLTKWDTKGTISDKSGCDVEFQVTGAITRTVL